MTLFMKTVGNPFMKMILRSPMHPLMSKDTAIITVTGKKSGTRYSLPVNYQRKDDFILITSMKDRTWWRNLRGGADVRIRIRGEDFRGHAEIFEEQLKVEKHFGEYLQLNPVHAKYFDVGVVGPGEFVPEDLATAARDRVMVRVVLA